MRPRRGRGGRVSVARVAVGRVLLVLPFAVLAARAAQLSVLEERGARLGIAQSQRTLVLPPERGTLFDRSGVELALTVDAPSVYAIPPSVEDPKRAAQALAGILKQSASHIEARLGPGSGFRFVARWVKPEQAERVRALGLAGVDVLEEPRRVYPHGELAAALVGFANIDGEGVRGVEQSEDAWLRGSARRIPVERDARGRLLVRSGEHAWSTAGGDVMLTLDATLQARAQEALRDAVARTGAHGGIVISLDPKGGDVLALAEEPSFDPNGFRRLAYRETRARAFLDAGDPGSTFKAFLVAAALDANAVAPDTSFECEEDGYRVPGKTIRDREDFGVLDVEDVLRVSSNIGAVKIAQALGPRAHFEALRRFGFGSATGSGFPDESAGLLRPWEAWRPVDHATIAFGQGVAVTPVQLAAATAALANGGVLVQPRLVRGRRAGDGGWIETPAGTERRAVSPRTAELVRGMLETVVADGTGRRARLAGVRVAGKTGTAQKFDPQAGRYAGDRFVAWFTGFVPAEDPALVIVVALDEPRRPHTGGGAAAPLFAQVAAAQLASFGILTEPDGDAAPAPQVQIARAEPPPVAAAPRERREPRLEVHLVEERWLVPDFRGHSDAEVRRAAAAAGLRVDVSGAGLAIAQDPPPGTVLDRGDPVRVRFAAGAGET